MGAPLVAGGDGGYLVLLVSHPQGTPTSLASRMKAVQACLDK